MKTLVAPFAAAVLLVSITACGDDDGARQQASDPATQSEVPAPSAVPAAPGPVRSRSLPTVMDTGSGPEL